MDSGTLAGFVVAVLAWLAFVWLLAYLAIRLGVRHALADRDKRHQLDELRTATIRGYYTCASCGTSWKAGMKDAPRDCPECGDRAKVTALPKGWTVAAANAYGAADEQDRTDR